MNNSNDTWEKVATCECGSCCCWCEAGRSGSNFWIYFYPFGCRGNPVSAVAATTPASASASVAATTSMLTHFACLLLRPSSIRLWLHLYIRVDNKCSWLNQPVDCPELPQLSLPLSLCFAGSAKQSLNVWLKLIAVGPHDFDGTLTLTCSRQHMENNIRTHMHTHPHTHIQLHIVVCSPRVTPPHRETARGKQNWLRVFSFCGLCCNAQVHSPSWNGMSKRLCESLRESLCPLPWYAAFEVCVSNNNNNNRPQEKP